MLCSTMTKLIQTTSSPSSKSEKKKVRLDFLCENTKQTYRTFQENTDI